MVTLKHKTVSGVRWQIISKFLEKGISVATFAVLARILNPPTFGLFAMSFIAIDALSLFKAFGFDSAIVQRKDRVDEASHTAFFMTQLTGVVLFIICYLAAPAAARFFNNKEVLAIIRALGFVFVFSNISKIPAALLAKSMRFKLISMTQLIAAAVNSTAAIVFALHSPTVWSLVWAYLLKQLTTSALFWYFSDYRLKWEFHPELAGEIFHFGKFMVGLGLLSFLVGNLSGMVVGKILGAVALGYYALAQNMTNIVNTHFAQLISQVLFPAYSSIQGDPERLKRAFLKTIRFVSLFTIPFSVGMIYLAKDLVSAVYGQKWLEIIPYVQVLGFIQIFIPFLTCTRSIFTGCGRPQYSYRMGILDICIRLPLLILFTREWGILGAISSGLVTSTILSPIHMYLVRKIVKFEMKELVLQTLPAIYSSSVMLMAIVFLKLLLHMYSIFENLIWHQGIALVLMVFIGLAAYFLSLFYVDRDSSLEVKHMIFNLKGPKPAV